MPDDQLTSDAIGTPHDLKALAPSALLAVGLIALLRHPRLIATGVAGALLYGATSRFDADRKAHGRDAATRRVWALRRDTELEDSFPASDPPSSSGGITAGAPD
jgi:hypothetical protein